MRNLKDQREVLLRGLRFPRWKILQMKSVSSGWDGGSGDERTSKCGQKLKLKSFTRSEKCTLFYSFFFFLFSEMVHVCVRENGRERERLRLVRSGVILQIIEPRILDSRWLGDWLALQFGISRENRRNHNNNTLGLAILSMRHTH